MLIFGDVGVYLLGIVMGNDVIVVKLIFFDGGDFVGIENLDGSINFDYMLNIEVFVSVLLNGVDFI